MEPLSIELAIYSYYEAGLSTFGHNYWLAVLFISFLPKGYIFGESFAGQLSETMWK